MSKHIFLKNVWIKSAVCETVLIEILILKFTRLCDGLSYANTMEGIYQTFCNQVTVQHAIKQVAWK